MTGKTLVNTHSFRNGQVAFKVGNTIYAKREAAQAHADRVNRAAARRAWAAKLKDIEDELFGAYEVHGGYEPMAWTS